MGFKPKYEPKTFTLIDAFEAKTPYYDKETDNQLKKRRELGDSSARKLVKNQINFKVSDTLLIFILNIME